MNKIENDVAISVSGLTKVYKLPLSKGGKADKSFTREAVKHATEKSFYAHAVNSEGVVKSGSTEFKALDEISFDIKKGEIVGIIGHNGAGKSTLLKLITGVAFPTKGSIEINGKIASLLELGSGFNPDLTGIENIFFNGSLNGLSNKDVIGKIPEILKFADIGDYINEPVRTYSSGMFARLAFATAININPEILIIDEILSVGDIGFQVKCMEKFLEFKESGKTIIFVSHSLDVVKKFCARVIWLDHGKIVSDGNPVIIVERYFNINYNLANKETKGNILHKDFEDFQLSWERSKTEGEINMDFKSLLKLHGQFNSAESFEKTYFRIDLIRCDGKAGIETEFDMLVNSFTSIDGGLKTGIQAGNNQFDFEIEKLNLMAGDYYLDFLIVEDKKILFRKINIFNFRILDEYRGEGIIIPEHEWGD